MNIAVATMFSPAYKPIVDITLPVLKKYCERHDYELNIINVPDWDYSYRKHEWLKGKLKTDVDVIFYIDCDALITNEDIKIESFLDGEHDFFVSEDINEINGGVFLLKNTRHGRWFNNLVLMCKGLFINEQNVYVDYKDILTKVGIMKLLSHPSFNSFPYHYYPEYKNITHEQGNWETGDFVCHVPGKSLQERETILKAIKEHANTEYHN